VEAEASETPCGAWPCGPGDIAGCPRTVDDWTPLRPDVDYEAIEPAIGWNIEAVFAPPVELPWYE